MIIEKLKIKGFKCFKEERIIDFSNLNLLFGSNSSGKSTTIQALMILKQTYESGGEGQFDLLLNGKYTNLGSLNDIINKDSDNYFGIGIALKENIKSGLNPPSELYWEFFRDENKINKVSLSKVSFKSEEKKYSFSYNKKNKILINDNQDSKIEKIKVAKLRPVSLYYYYHKKHNKMIHDYLYELFSLFAGKDKIIAWNREEDYYKEYKNIVNAFTRLQNKYENDYIFDDNPDENIKKLIIDVNDFRKKLEKNLDLEEEFSLLDYKLYALIIVNDNSKEIREIIDKYKNIFETEQNNSNNLNKELREVKLYNEYNPFINNLDIEGLDEIRSLNINLNDIFPKIKYLGPIRENPKNIYNYDSDINPTYVGKYGQFLPGIIAYFNDYKISMVDPEKNIKKEVNFGKALKIWMEYIGLSEDINANVSNGVSLEVNDRGIKSNIVNVGVGISQVLPVIAMGLLSSEDDILIFEQPELHLHPYAQSKLMDFFVALIKSGRQIIIETHSEYFLHRLRYLVLDDKIKKENVNILFYNNKDTGVDIKKAKLTQMGQFKFPIGFKDSTEKLIDDILRKRLEKI